MSGNRGGVVRVVVIDDEKDLRALIRRRLERTGEYSVVAEAADTTSAIAVVEAHQPDVALLDLMLGADYGADIIGDLLRVAPLTMIAVLTVLAAEDQEEAVRNAGAFVFHEKTKLVDLPAHLREDLAIFHRAIGGEDVVAPSALTRRA